jgi:hypothetical protein
MQTVGNRAGDEIYGVEKVSPDASKEEKQRFVVDKYEKRLFASKAAPEPAKRAPQPAIDVRKAPAPNSQPAQKHLPANATATAAPHVAREIEFPDSLFDELFKDTKHEFTASAPTLPNFTESRGAQPLQPKVETTHNSLDAFLNSALQAPSAPKTNVVDPFADWPEF